VAGSVPTTAVVPSPTCRVALPLPRKRARGHPDRGDINGRAINSRDINGCVIDEHGGTRMHIEVEPSGQHCGAIVRGVDLRELDAAGAETLRGIWLRHRVIALPGQRLDLGEFERAAALFGPFGEDPYFRTLPGHPHVAEIRREADETTPLFAEGWHSDWSFLPVPPAMTLLYGRVIPPVGGDTLYADQHAAYEALPDAMKARLDGLLGIHSARRGYSRAGMYGDRDVGRSMAIVPSDSALATQLHPLVRVHPETGLKALFLSPGYTIGVEGMHDDDAQALLRELYAHQAEERFVYRHRWSEGMVTMWDNRAVIHAATGGYQGHQRLLHRITISERNPPRD
jgi:taurine dioxygenase